MIWYIVSLIGLAVVLGALYWWGRDDEPPPIVASVRDVHGARAGEGLSDPGNGPGDAGPM